MENQNNETKSITYYYAKGKVIGSEIRTESVGIIMTEKCMKNVLHTLCVKNGVTGVDMYMSYAIAEIDNKEIMKVFLDHIITHVAIETVGKEAFNLIQNPTTQEDNEGGIIERFLILNHFNQVAGQLIVWNDDKIAIFINNIRIIFKKEHFKINKI